MFTILIKFNIHFTFPFSCFFLSFYVIILEYFDLNAIYMSVYIYANVFVFMCRYMYVFFLNQISWIYWLWLVEVMATRGTQ